jgi:hypothetical protein
MSPHAPLRLSSCFEILAVTTIHRVKDIQEKKDYAYVDLTVQIMLPRICTENAKVVAPDSIKNDQKETIVK